VKTKELVVTRIGNSRGVRLPAETLRRYNIGDRVILEEREDEIVLRPKRGARAKLDWENTYRQMAASSENWADWESLPDGLEED
jgi:antitoxin component of MazEF toxin-antitoxin module